MWNYAVTIFDQDDMVSTHHVGADNGMEAFELVVNSGMYHLGYGTSIVIVRNELQGYKIRFTVEK